jgi:tetratricopeptide (TPR) repeat protein
LKLLFWSSLAAFVPWNGPPPAEDAREHGAHAVPPAAHADASSLTEQRFDTDAELVDGEWWVSVRTQEAPLALLLAELAGETGIEFDGLERLPQALRVSAHLEHRPLRQAVAWILGSVGLRADRRADTFTLHVDADAREDLLSQAETEYLRTLREFPNHPLADRALLGQGLLEEDRGEAEAARARYEGLIEAYPESELVDDALRRCAELHAGAKRWDLAAQRWAQLLRLESGSEHEVLAYEQLALCTAQLGEPERALYMLDDLDELAPAADETQRHPRLLIRARALVGLGDHHQALEALADADGHARSGAPELAAHELRALALTGLEEHGAAARAWLAFCEGAEGDELARGLRAAAASALAAGDELAVLFIERLAVKRGLDGAVAEEARAARARLDLVSGRLSGLADVERLARAERLLAAGLHAEAGELLEALAPTAPLLEEPERLRFVLALGRALGAGGAEPAIAFFREQLPSLSELEHRKQVYLLAAEMLEAEGRIDQAIEAYQGRL